MTVTVCGERNKLYAKSYDAGWHPTAEHVQGAETDRYGDYFYYSFADRLIKQSADGEVVGTVTGITGHMGDAAYNRADDKLYVSYTRKDGGDKLCYMLIFDCEKIDKLNMKFEDVCTCVYVGAPILELAKENGYDAEGNALSDEWLSLSGKYGVNNSIDSCTFGPKFGVNDGKTYLTMGLGAPGQSEKKFPWAAWKCQPPTEQTTTIKLSCSSIHQIGRITPFRLLKYPTRRVPKTLTAYTFLLRRARLQRAESVLRSVHEYVYYVDLWITRGTSKRGL